MAKSNKEYWTDRFLLLKQKQLIKDANFYKEIEKSYKNSISIIEDKFSYWLNRLAKNEKLDLADAKKKLNRTDLKKFKIGVEQYIKLGKSANLNPAIMKLLETESAIQHLSMLQAMEYQLKNELSILTQKNINKLSKHLEQTYIDNYYNTAYEFSNVLNISFNFVKVDFKKVEQVINHVWTTDGETFSQRLWTNQNKMVDELKIILSRDLAIGTSPKKTIDDLSKKLNAGLFQTGRVIMTESASIASMGEFECYKNLGVEEYEILATLDTKTSKICQRMDGVHLPLEDFKMGVTAPPFHPFCRTTTIPYYNDEFTINETRASGNDQEFVLIDAKIKYPQWKKLNNLK